MARDSVRRKSIAVRETTAVLLPSGFGGVLVEVLGRDVVVLAVHHATEPGEVGLSLSGVGFLGDVALGVVDAAHNGELAVEGVSMGSLISVDSRLEYDIFDSQGDALGFALANEGLGDAVALAEGDDDATLAVLVLGLATVLPALLVVSQADLAAEVGTVHLDLTGELDALVHGERWASSDIPPSLDDAYRILTSELDRVEPTGSSRPRP